MFAVRVSLWSAILLLHAMFSGIVMSRVEAEDFRDRYEYREFKNLPYRLLQPKNYNADRVYPLVIFFHGAGERGDDNQKQLVHGMAEFASDDVMQKHPCIVVAPQCPSDIQWVDTPWTADSHTMPKQPTLPMQLSLELIGVLQNEFSIDEDRIYVTGLSMGGFGAWDAIQRQPKRFAAAVPICGGGDPTYATRIAHVPIWAFHGDKDTTVKVKRSRDMITAIEEAVASPKYTEYPGVGHNSWTATYANREMYQWLFAQNRSD